MNRLVFEGLKVKTIELTDEEKEEILNRQSDPDLLQAEFEKKITKKINELSKQCRNSIMYDFIASNGHQYRLEIEDQLNMQGQKDELDNDDTISKVMWRTMDSGYIEHTREEWYSVFREGFNHKKTQLFKLDELRTQALNATTQEELDLIVW